MSRHGRPTRPSPSPHVSMFASVRVTHPPTDWAAEPRPRPVPAPCPPRPSTRYHTLQYGRRCRSYPYRRHPLACLRRRAVRLTPRAASFVPRRRAAAPPRRRAGPHLLPEAELVRHGRRHAPPRLGALRARRSDSRSTPAAQTAAAHQHASSSSYLGHASDRSVQLAPPASAHCAARQRQPHRRPPAPVRARPVGAGLLYGSLCLCSRAGAP